MNKNQERKVIRTFRRAMSTPAGRKTEIKRMPFRAAFVAVFFAMFGGLVGVSLFAAPAANGATGGDEPTPTPSQTITLKAKVTGSAIANASGGAKVTASSSAFDYVALQVMSKAKTKAGSCYWSPGWNYNPGVGWHYETTPMKVCKLAKSKMVAGKRATYLKKGGGASGSACGNWAIPTTNPPKRPSPLVLDLRTGQRGAVKTKATAAADTIAAVDVFLSYAYNGQTFTTTDRVESTGHATASASDKASFKMSKHIRVKATGASINKAVIRAENKAKASADAKARADALAKAEASAELTVTIVIPGTPPGHDECPNIPGDQPEGYECYPPEEEHQNPVAEIFFGEHAVDYQGTMPVFGRVRAFDGATPVLGSPVVTPSDLGMVSNWRPVPTNKDGAPCEAGWVCYQGTFRVTKTGTPGTYVYGEMTAKATDSEGGEFTTQPKQFSVYYRPVVET